MKKKILILLLMFVSLIIMGQEKLYKEGSFVIVEKEGLEYAFNPSQSNFEMRSDRVTLRDNVKNYFVVLFYATVQDSSGTLYGSKTVVDSFLKNNLTSFKTEPDGSISTTRQDQTTPPIEYFMTRTLDTVIITNLPTAQSNRIELQNGHTVVVDDFIEIYNEDTISSDFILKRFAQLRIIKVSADTVWSGQFIGFDITATSLVHTVRTNGNMAVNASLESPIRFSMGPPNGLKWDLTRTMIGMILDSQPDDSQFGDIDGGLVNGVFFGFEGDLAVDYLVHIKFNAGFRGTCYDVQYVPRSLPAGSYGLSLRKSFGGEDKYGVVIRLEGETNDRFVQYVQDDLTDLLDYYQKIMGHIVQD